MDWKRPMAYRLDEHGEPEPLDMSDPNRWGDADPFRDPRRQVARNDIDEYEVSTVFLVVDHGWQGEPVLWETMIFPRGWRDNASRRRVKDTAERYTERYTSREAAALGHARIVAALLAGKTPEHLSE